MSILYVGPYRQSDEWGYTSQAFAKLLVEQKGLEVVLRPVWFNNQDVSADIGNLEQYEYNELETADILIQHGLPSYLNYNGKFRTNIAVTSVDCRIDNTDWVTHLNLFDKVIVFSGYEAELLKESGVTVPIHGFGFPPVILHPEVQDLDLKFSGTKYYTIGSLDMKSGLRETIAAYLSSFSILDSTILIVLTNDSAPIETEINNIKSHLGIFNNPQHYPHIALINNTEIPLVNYVHGYADFYIDVSYNARTSQNTLKAIVNNSLPIMLDTCTGLMPGYPFVVDSHEEVSIYPNRPLQTLYSGEFNWRVPRMSDLRSVFQSTYNMTDEQKEQESQRMAGFRSKMFELPRKWLEIALTQKES